MLLSNSHSSLSVLMSSIFWCFSCRLGHLSTMLYQYWLAWFITSKHKNIRKWALDRYYLAGTFGDMKIDINLGYTLYFWSKTSLPMISSCHILAMTIPMYNFPYQIITPDRFNHKIPELHNFFTSDNFPLSIAPLILRLYSSTNDLVKKNLQAINLKLHKIPKPTK